MATTKESRQPHRVVEQPGASALAGGTGAVQRLTQAAMAHYRWIICSLLFFATTINYVDRQIIGLLKPTLQEKIGWNEIDYSNIIFAFQLAYAVGLLVAGRVMDRLGTRKGYSLSVLFWSVAAMAHALAHSVMGFGAARAALGLGEGGNYPACLKAVAEWFPKKERALATGSRSGSIAKYQRLAIRCSGSRAPSPGLQSDFSPG
jgi:MFS family permease